MINKIKKIIKDFGLSEIRAGMKITGKQLINDKITPLIEKIKKEAGIDNLYKSYEDKKSLERIKKHPEEIIKLK